MRPFDAMEGLFATDLEAKKAGDIRQAKKSPDWPVWAGQVDQGTDPDEILPDMRPCIVIRSIGCIGDPAQNRRYAKCWKVDLDSTTNSSPRISVHHNEAGDGTKPLDPTHNTHPFDMVVQNGVLKVEALGSNEMFVCQPDGERIWMGRGLSSPILEECDFPNFHGIQIYPNAVVQEQMVDGQIVRPTVIPLRDNAYLVVEYFPSLASTPVSSPRVIPSGSPPIFLELAENPRRSLLDPEKVLCVNVRVIFHLELEIKRLKDIRNKTTYDEAAIRVLEAALTLVYQIQPTCMGVPEFMGYVYDITSSPSPFSVSSPSQDPTGTWKPDTFVSRVVSKITDVTTREIKEIFGPIHKIVERITKQRRDALFTTPDFRHAISEIIGERPLSYRKRRREYERRDQSIASMCSLLRPNYPRQTWTPTAIKGMTLDQLCVLFAKRPKTAQEVRPLEIRLNAKTHKPELVVLSQCKTLMEDLISRKKTPGESRKKRKSSAAPVRSDDERVMKPFVKKSMGEINPSKKNVTHMLTEVCKKRKGDDDMSVTKSLTSDAEFLSFYDDLPEPTKPQPVRFSGLRRSRA
jgi:hypothetical protein